MLFDDHIFLVGIEYCGLWGFVTEELSKEKTFFCFFGSFYCDEFLPIVS